MLDAEFDKAVNMLRTGNVEGGVEKLRRFADENPRHPRADNALYFSGLGQIGLNEFKGAAKTFERLIDKYPAGDAMLDGMLRLAECRMRLNQSADAKVLYTRVVTQFPGTAAATQAEQRLAALPSDASFERTSRDALPDSHLADVEPRRRANRVRPAGERGRAGHGR